MSREAGVPGPAPVAAALDPEAAFARVADEIESLDPSLVRPKVDAHIPRVVSIVLGVEPELARMKEEMALQVPGYDVTCFDRVPVLAMATLYTHLTMTRPPGAEVVAEMLARARPLRDRLLRLADGFAGYGFFDPDRLAAVREGGRTQVAVGAGLLGLVGAFREAAPRLDGQTLPQGDLDEAAALGPALLQAVGEREVSGRIRKDPADAERRLRAFSLLVHTWDQCRRAASFLRWREGDAERFVPSFYRRKRPGRKAKAIVQDPPAAPLPDDAVPPPA